MGFVAFYYTALGVTGLPILWFGGRAQFWRSVDCVVLSHYLFTLHFSRFFASSTRFVASGPFRHFPSNWAVQDIAVLSIWWWGLRAHVIWDYDSVTTPLGYFVDTVHFSRLDSKAATLRARRKIRVVPSGWARMVVAGPH